MVPRAIELLDAITRQPVPANFVEVDALAMVRAEQVWSPFRLTTIERLLIAGQIGAMPQHVQWNWAVKALQMSVARRGFAVERSNRVEGMMLLAPAGIQARLPAATGSPLVYVDYIEAAPWNNRAFVASPEFRGVGLRLMQAAVQCSSDAGWDGRVGLHSLPQAAQFYTRTCGMVSLGPDPTSAGLTYFELDRNSVSALTAR